MASVAMASVYPHKSKYCTKVDNDQLVEFNISIHGK